MSGVLQTFNGAFFAVFFTWRDPAPGSYQEVYQNLAGRVRVESGSASRVGSSGVKNSYSLTGRVGPE